ncbi:MAG: phosphoesterase [Gammaproteobacteria bacterium]|nr:phosphoesterase [Gammaproteobacteria bacterium]
MSRQELRMQKASKFFYVRVYRWSLNLVLVSIVLNVGLVVLDWLYYLHRPSTTYYATSGVTRPIKLTWRSLPNHSQHFLLPSTPPVVQVKKRIPD